MEKGTTGGSKHWQNAFSLAGVMLVTGRCCDTQLMYSTDGKTFNKVTPNDGNNYNQAAFDGEVIIAGGTYSSTYIVSPNFGLSTLEQQLRFDGYEVIDERKFDSIETSSQRLAQEVLNLEVEIDIANPVSLRGQYEIGDDATQSGVVQVILSTPEDQFFESVTQIQLNKQIFSVLLVTFLKLIVTIALDCSITIQWIMSMLQLIVPQSMVMS